MRLILPLLIVLSSCSGSILKTLQTLPRLPSGQDFSDSLNATVLVFIDIDCPISQYVIKPLNTLKAECKGQIEVIGIVPGTYYSNKELQAFMTDYEVQFTIINDSSLKLVKRFDARVTPEVFLLNKKAKVLYRGAVDNKYVELGKSKPLPNQSFLSESVREFLADKTIRNPKTEAVGCIIEQ